MTATAEARRARLIEVRRARLRVLLAARREAGTLTPERTRAFRELLRDRKRSDYEIARLIGTTHELVRRARHELEDARVIGIWRHPLTGRPPKAGIPGAH